MPDETPVAAPLSPEQAEHLWPTPQQLLLLDAALADRSRALEAYAQWRASIDLDAEFSPAVLRLLPAVYENLRAAGLADPLMGRLKGVYRRAWYESRQLFHRVQPIARALADRGIPVLVLKGAALLLDYYRQHGLRPMADVDLWVPRPAIEEATAMLRAHSWRLGTEPSPDHLRFHHAIQCFGPDGGELDLHWHVFWERGRDDVDAAVLAASEPIDFAGTPLRQLDPTTLLVHVVTHGIRWNRETPIRWIPDALIILRKRGPDVDWSRFARLVDELRARQRCWMGLSYLADRFGARVPGEVLADLGRRRPTLLERIDNSVLLHSDERYARSAWRQQWAQFAEYCRRTDATNPLSFAVGYTHYIRYRWHLDGRRDIPRRVWQGLRRRLAGAGHRRVAA